MKHILFLLINICTCIFAMAQMPQPGNGPGKQVNNGHVFGKITDSAGKGLANVSVLVLKRPFKPGGAPAKDILLSGTTTKAKGEFNFEELPINGKLVLKISSIGYIAVEQTISFMPDFKPDSAKKGPMPAQGGGPGGFSTEKDLGAIQLATASNELSGVVVTSTRSLMKLDIDKKIFNVDKNIVSEGGTGVDVMKNVPSVQVDIDGNVSLRNSTPQIFVDGLPTTLTLEQIPASAIESVEVITNPSAKYDASGGGAGILNIVLKKNKRVGYNGNVRAGINKYGAVDGGLDFNVRQQKINLSAGINVRQASDRVNGTINRTNLTDNPVTVVNQVNTDRNKGTMIFGRVGLDYFLTNKTTLSLSAMKMHGGMSPYSQLRINTDSLYNTGTTTGYSERNTNNTREFNGQGLTFALKHIYREGEELTANVNYFTGKANNSSNYTTDYYYAGKGSTILNSETQKVLGGGRDKNIILQTDYSKQMGVSKIEAGARAAIRSRINLNDNYTLDNGSGDYILLPSAASNYKSSDNVYAGYLSFTSKIKNFGYKLGLRAESSSYDGELMDTKEKFSNKYPISLFPSVFLSQKLSDNQELQLSYTRRINRPNFFQLIPFVDSTDKLNIRQGNPNLVPEFTQSFEMNYLRTFKGNNTILAAIYYRKTDNLITSFLDQQTDVYGNTKLITSFINANSAYSAGSELTVQNTITKWWNTSTDINVYNSKITTTTSAASQPALWSWFAKLNSNFKLPSDFSIQLSAMYQSKTNLITNNNQGGGQGGPGGPPPGMGSQSASQGYIKAFYAVDAAIKKTFLKNKFSASLSVNDIFRSRKQNQYSYSSYFTQDYSRVRDPQMVRLNLAYSFGKIDASLFKRKNQNTEQMSSDSQ